MVFFPFLAVRLTRVFFWGRYVIFGQVLAYYTDGTVTARVSQYIHSSIGLFAAFVACGFLESLWERDEVVEASTIVATVLILAGQHHWHVSRSYGGSGVSSSRGSIIGYETFNTGKLLQLARI